jgi:hypothetical protein
MLLVLLTACGEDAPSDGASSTSQGGAGGSNATSTGTGGGPSSSSSGTGGSTGGAGPFAPNPQLEGLGEGSALDLGEFSCTTPAGEEPGYCFGITDYSGITYDPRNHQILAFGGGHATTMTDSVVALELSGPLQWKSLYEPTPCEKMTADNLDSALGAWKAGDSGPYPRPLSAHTYDLIAAAPDQNEFVLLGRLFTGGTCNGVGNDVAGPIAHYDLAGGQWSFGAPGSDAFQSGIASAEFDPVSRKFVSLGSERFAIYDPSTREMQVVASELPSNLGSVVSLDTLGYSNDMVYHPPTDTFYYFLRGNPVRTFALVFNRNDPAQSTLDEVTTSGPTSPHDEPGYDYDAKTQTLGGGVKDSMIYRFDPQTAAWTSHQIPGNPGSQAFRALSYDPVNHVFVFIADIPSGRHTWAYRPEP